MQWRALLSYNFYKFKIRIIIIITVCLYFFSLLKNSHFLILSTVTGLRYLSREYFTRFTPQIPGRNFKEKEGRMCKGRTDPWHKERPQKRGPQIFLFISGRNQESVDRCVWACKRTFIHESIIPIIYEDSHHFHPDGELLHLYRSDYFGNFEHIIIIWYKTWGPPSWIHYLAYTGR